MAISFVTGNSHKFEEVSAVLSEFGIELRQEKVDVPEYETSSLKESAIEKAKTAFARLRQPLIVEDTGVYFDAFEDFPGAKPKWVVERIGLEGLLKLLAGKARGAHFHTIICFMDSPTHYRVFEGRLRGTISKKIIKPSAKVMPYEKIFVPEGMKKALAELGRAEKNRISHRAQAARLLGKYLGENVLHELLDSLD